MYVVSNWDSELRLARRRMEWNHLIVFKGDQCNDFIITVVKTNTNRISSVCHVLMENRRKHTTSALILDRNEFEKCEWTFYDVPSTFPQNAWWQMHSHFNFCVLFVHKFATLQLKQPAWFNYEPFLINNLSISSASSNGNGLVASSFQWKQSLLFSSLVCIVCGFDIFHFDSVQFRVKTLKQLFQLFKRS